MPHKRIIVAGPQSGWPLTALLRARLGVSLSQARHWIHEARVSVNGRPCTTPSAHVRAGQRIDVQPASPVRSLPAGLKIRYSDAAILVVDKPAGITTVRDATERCSYGARALRYLPETLVDLLIQQLAGGNASSVRAVHRLDRDTSGLIVLARTKAAQQSLSKQFRDHSIERCYIGIVRGRPHPGRIESELGRDRGDGRRGSVTPGSGGKPAVTHVAVKEQLGNFTVVECTLETGRTHQVRIHLGENGSPLCGEQIYDRGRDGRRIAPDTSGMARPALHAALLGFRHPATGKQVRWTSALPPDMARLIKRLRLENPERHSLGTDGSSGRAGPTGPKKD